MTAGIVLYGPPASGKDTITDALGSGFALVPRLKCGPGRTAGYRMVDEGDLAALRRTPGEVLWEIRRYAATYMLTRSDVLAIAESAAPVVHVGQSAAIDAVTSGIPELSWVVVELRCPRELAAERIAARSTGDDAERLARYEDTPLLDSAHLVIDTSAAAPAEAARQITQAAAPPIVVPAPTFQTSSGAIDTALTGRYTARIAASWVPYVLVNGPMGRGEYLNYGQRAANLTVWVSALPPDRIIAACWTATELVAVHAAGLRPLVMLQATDEADLRAQLGEVPPDTWVYANPRYSRELLTPEAASEHQVAGVKLSKVEAGELYAMRAANPHATLVHGSSRHIQTSLDAGADLVTAPPLAAYPADLPPADMGTIQRVVDATQRELDALDGHDARVDWIGRRAAESTSDP